MRGWEPDDGLASACAGAYEEGMWLLCGSEGDTVDRQLLREELFAVRSSALTGSR